MNIHENLNNRIQFITHTFFGLRAPPSYDMQQVPCLTVFLFSFLIRISSRTFFYWHISTRLDKACKASMYDVHGSPTNARLTQKVGESD